MHEPDDPRNRALGGKHDGGEDKTLTEPRCIHCGENEVRQPGVDGVAHGVHDAEDDGALFGVGGADFAVVFVRVLCCLKNEGR